ncbi:unnamed protein product [Brassica napus]|uniref:(rape) hypothetical protein n=1 Tax=Brassica napus TaxID=3708 RepID=A0A816JY49_BRANA|nr:unnamed protein product [Brassica napus]
MKPETFASLVSAILYEKRFGPYLCQPVIAGLGEDDKPFICTMDSIGAKTSLAAITRRITPAIVCAKRSPIEGVSEELNLIASEELDQAPARRRVRSAFVDLQLQLDHCLFKKAPVGIRTEEWYERNSKGRRFSASVGCRRPELKSKRRCVSVMVMAVLALSCLMV